jgi:amidase
MKRREFLRDSALAGAAVAAARGVPTAASAPPAVRRDVPPSPLDEATVAQLQGRFASGEASARSITQAYLDRIAAVDRGGPAVNSVIEVNPDALAIADSLDAERKTGRVRGPLHGIPVLIKDNIDTADRMMTTAGSLALEGPPAAREASIVGRLREAGAVVLGKANLSEWANFRSTRSSSGWSARGGQTKNPYVLDRNPCGSSSGSGAAVAANLCVVAVGTETDGSIVCPAHNNGLVGIKPTIGLVSRTGIVPIAESQDTAGPMARTVADAVHLLDALVGVDPRDAATARSVGKAASGYAKFLDANGLKGARLGVARKMAGFNEHVDKVFDAAIDDLRRLGAIVVDVDFPTLKDVGAPEFELLLYEFKAGLTAYLATRGDSVQVRNLKDLIEFNETHRERELRYFGQEIVVQAENKGPLTTPAYRAARRQCARLSRTLGIDAVMTKHTLDVVVAPTGGPAWPTDLINGDHFAGGSASTLPAVAGYPHLTVPMGQVFGLPVGLSFFGRAWSEPTLIRCAFAYEQATGQRKAPRFLPTLEGAT